MDCQAVLPDWLQAVALGIIQGLTEFLPISSSAHLVLFPELGGGEYLGKGFDVALHVGTLGAVLLYLHRDVEALTRAFRGLLRERRVGADPDRRMLVLLALATVPAGLAGLLLEDRVEEIFHGVPTIAAMLVGFGILLGAADSLGRRDRDLGSLGPREALWIGAAQALALAPGVSRSGATITTGLALGLDREQAARFSFLLSIPVIAGAGLLKARPALPEAVTPETALLGMAAAFLSGLACIHLLLRYLRNGSFLPFVAYRVVFGLLLLLRA